MEQTEQTGYEKNQAKADRRGQLMDKLAPKNVPKPRDRVDEVIEFDTYEVTVKEQTWYGDNEKKTYAVGVNQTAHAFGMPSPPCDKPEKPTWKPTFYMNAELDDRDQARELASKVAGCLQEYGFAKLKSEPEEREEPEEPEEKDDDAGDAE